MEREQRGQRGGTHDEENVGGAVAARGGAPSSAPAQGSGAPVQQQPDHAASAAQAPVAAAQQAVAQRTAQLQAHPLPPGSTSSSPSTPLAAQQQGAANGTAAVAASHVTLLPPSDGPEQAKLAPATGGSAGPAAAQSPNAPLQQPVVGQAAAEQQPSHGAGAQPAPPAQAQPASPPPAPPNGAQQQQRPGQEQQQQPTAAHAPPPPLALDPPAPGGPPQPSGASASTGASPSPHEPTQPPQPPQPLPQLASTSTSTPEAAGPSGSALRSPLSATRHPVPRKHPSAISRHGTEASSRDLHDHDTLSVSSVAISDGTSSNTELDLATLQALREQARQPPGRHASMPAIQHGPHAPAGPRDRTKALPHRVASMNSASAAPGGDAAVGGGAGAAGADALSTTLTSSTHYQPQGGSSNHHQNLAPTSVASTSSGGTFFAAAGPEAAAAAAGAEGGGAVGNGGGGGGGVPGASGSSATRMRGPTRGPSRLGPSAAVVAAAAGGAGRVSMGGADASQRMVSSTSLATLQKTVEQMMLQDSEMLHKVQSSMRGISSLAKETNNLEMGRDATGATCINQYVVVKTLGRGSFGKVKLCLNTLDGQLYAIKMVNRSFIVRQLQKPQKGLRKRQPARNTSGQQTLTATATAGVLGPLSSGTTSTVLEGSPSSFTNAAAPPPSSAANAPSPSTTAVHSAVAPGEGGGAAAAGPRSRVLDSVTASAAIVVSSRMSLDEGNPLDSVMREIAVLKKLDHPNVVKLHEVIDPPGASHMMLVMEYMERGPVLETKGQTGFGSFPERIARDYFRQACAGLDYLHYHNVVHGDLKPENLLVTSAGQLKIGDFGSARMMSDATASSKVSCTPAFQPPEALTNPGQEDPHSADVWALGVCLYCFIFGRLPFTGSCLLDISNAIRNDEVRFPPEAPISAELQDLFQRVLDKEPSTRLTLLGVMEHAWVTDRGAAPLPSLRSLAAPPKMIEVSRNEAQAAIDRGSVVSMIRARLKEKTFTPGEVLFQEGDEAHCIYMIMSGVVEIVTRLNKDVDTSMVDAMDEQSFSVDLDESFTLDCNQLVPTGLDLKDGRLHIDRNKAQALKERMRTVLLNRQAEYVTEVKGPGQVIGDVGLDKSQVARHQHTARARDTVTVVKLTEESFLKAIMQQQHHNQGSGGGAGDVVSAAGLGASHGDDEPLYSTRAAEEHDSREQQATATPLQPPTPQPLQPPGPSASSSTVSGGVNGAAAPAGAAALDARDL